MAMDEAILKKMPALCLLSFSTFLVCVPAAYNQVISFNLMFDMNCFPSKDYAWYFPMFIAGECASMGLSACLIDRYGRRLPFLFGSVLFIPSSAICAVCGDSTVFLACRFIEGFGAGIVIVTCIAQIYFDVPDKKNRYMANGIMSLGFGGGMLFGIFLGRALVETVGWPVAFWTVAVLQAVVMYPCMDILRNGENSKMKADIPGSLILMVMAGVLVFFLQKLYLSWDVTDTVGIEWIVFLFMLFLALILVEVVNPQSIFHRKFDNHKLVAGSMIFIFLLGVIDMAAVGCMVKIAFFTYQMSVGEAAPYFIILVLGAAVTAVTISKTIDRTGHFPWFVLSAVLSPIALLSMLLVDKDDPAIFMALHLFVLGLAIGCLVSMLNATIQNRTDHNNNGAVMSFAIMFRTIALWIGYNFYTVFSDRFMGEELGATMAHWSQITQIDLPADSNLASLLVTPLADLIKIFPGLTDQIAEVFGEGISYGLTVGAIVFVVIALPVTFLLVGRNKTL